jgi:hypothetical protein
MVIKKGGEVDGNEVEPAEVCFVSYFQQIKHLGVQVDLSYHQS